MGRRSAAALVALTVVAAPGCRTERAAPGELVDRDDVALPTVEAFRMRYGSVDVRGDPSVVSALVAVPEGAAPRGGWPVVAYAHGTTGAGDDCDPSQDPSLGAVGTTLARLAAAGYVAVATDYEGIGTRGPHPYLHGPSEARAVVDGVAAARAAVPSSSTRWAVVGHSQGGHAALFAAQRAATLAPDLDLVGAVAIAPAADPAALADAGGAPAQALLVLGWLAADEGADGRSGALLTDEGRDVVERADEACAIDHGPQVIDPAARVPSFDAYLADNVAGREPATAPVLVVQGGADGLTPPAVARGVVERLCGLGSTVSLLEHPLADHLSVVETAAEDVDGWLADRFAGVEAPSSCNDAAL